jgi:hypothetical protein
MRQSWSDDRLDDLAKQADAGFSKMNTELTEVRREIAEQGKELREEIAAQGKELREEMATQGKDLRGEILNQGKDLRGEILNQGKDLRGEILNQGTKMHEDIRWLGERFDRFQDTIVRGFVSIIVTLIAALLTLNFT